MCMENEILNKILEGQNELKSSVDELKGTVKQLEEGQNELKGTVKQLEEGQNEIKSEVKELKDKVNDIDRVVMKIEHEHGDKIQAFLDAFAVNNEKYQEMKKEQEERFSNINFKLLKHDIRLDTLEKLIKK